MINSGGLIMAVTLAKAEPVTHANEWPSDLIGTLVRVRPYYHVPNGPSSLTPARSPYTYEARVTGTLGEMVVVEFTWETDSAPWRSHAAYFPRELHVAYRQCKCPACHPMGSGIHELRGA